MHHLFFANGTLTFASGEMYSRAVAPRIEQMQTRLPFSRVRRSAGMKSLSPETSTATSYLRSEGAFRSKVACEVSVLKYHFFPGRGYFRIKVNCSAQYAFSDKYISSLFLCFLFSFPFLSFSFPFTSIFFIFSVFVEKLRISVIGCYWSNKILHMKKLAQRGKLKMLT